MKKNNILYITTIIITMILGFVLGIMYQQNKMIKPSTFQSMRDRQPQMQNRNNTFRPLNGKVINIDKDSITIKLTDNSSKIVMITKNTEIHTTSKITLDDIKKNENIVVFGEINTDGSVVAQNIQINPMFQRAKVK